MTMKEIQINWESFVIVRDKKFHVETSPLNDMFICDLILCNAHPSFKNSTKFVSFHYQPFKTI